VRKASSISVLWKYWKKSRRGLSVSVCEAWQWRKTNDALRDMVSRGMLLILDRVGLVALHPLSYMRHKALSKRARPEPVLIDKTSIENRCTDCSH